MTVAERAVIGRRRLLEGAAGLGVLGLGGCVTASGQVVAVGGFREPDLPLAPIRAHADRVFDITVCTRPFRAQGPRLDAETIGDALIVHNYGHGGSGWSLSWGSSTIAVQKAMAGSPREVAVVGCGALGLTSATLAQRAGARVTIYRVARAVDHHLLRGAATSKAMATPARPSTAGRPWPRWPSWNACSRPGSRRGRPRVWPG